MTDPTPTYPLWTNDRLYPRDGLSAAFYIGVAHTWGGFYFESPESLSAVPVAARDGEDMRATVERALFDAGLWPVDGRLPAHLADPTPARERILCAANWYQTDDVIPHSPVNVPNGIVLCGHRHHNIIPTAAHIAGDRWLAWRAVEEQGFLTDANRWVSREEGYDIAEAAGQLDMTEVARRGGGRCLFSEDLY